MKIKKIIADRKPMFCVECPIYNSSIKTLKNDECGEYKENVVDGGWRVGGEVPDERCLFEID